VIRRTQGLVVLEAEFLQIWLDTAGLQERLHLACQHLPPQPESLELWDLWLELQGALLRSPLPEAQEESLVLALQDLGEGSLRVRAVAPPGRRLGLQADFPALRGAATVLEAVRLAWAAVLSTLPRPQDPLAVAGRVCVEAQDRRTEGDAPAEAAHAALERQPPPATGAPDACLLRLAELHNRLLPPLPPSALQSLLDLRPWVETAQAAPDADHEQRFLRAAQAAGTREAPELLRRGREAWKDWVDSPHEAVPGDASPANPPPSVPSAGKGRYRQLAAAPGSPGLAAATARRLGPGDGARSPAGSHAGEIVVCSRLPPRDWARIRGAAGLVTEQGGRLSFGAVLAARLGIPCACGVRGALARIADGDPLHLDGQLGVVTILRGCCGS